MPSDAQFPILEDPPASHDHVQAHGLTLGDFDLKEVSALTSHQDWSPTVANTWNIARGALATVSWGYAGGLQAGADARMFTAPYSRADGCLRAAGTALAVWGLEQVIDGKYFPQQPQGLTMAADLVGSAIAFVPGNLFIKGGIMLGIHTAARMLESTFPNPNLVRMDMPAYQTSIY